MTGSRQRRRNMPPLIPGRRQEDVRLRVHKREDSKPGCTRHPRTRLEHLSAAVATTLRFAVSALRRRTPNPATVATLRRAGAQRGIMLDSSGVCGSLSIWDSLANVAAARPAAGRKGWMICTITCSRSRRAHRLAGALPARRSSLPTTGPSRFPSATPSCAPSKALFARNWMPCSGHYHDENRPCCPVFPRSDDAAGALLRS